nr:hypothetical protein [Tanacetum cinerariifolium]
PVESHHTPTNAPSTSQPPTSTPSMQTIHDAEEPATIPHDLPLSKGRTSVDTEILLDQEEPTELVKDLGSGKKGEKEISTVIPEGGYKQSHFKGTIYEDIRFIFERVLDQIHAFVPMDSEIEKEVVKKSRFDLQQKQFAKEIIEKKDDSSSKPVGGSRKKSISKKRIGAKLDEESAKRQKLKDVTEEEATTEYEKEKEELRSKRREGLKINQS